VVLVSEVAGAGVTLSTRSAAPKLGTENSRWGLVQPELDPSYQPILSEDGDQRTLVQDLLAVLECHIQKGPNVGGATRSDASHQLQQIIHNVLRQCPFTAEANGQIEHIQSYEVDSV